MCQVTWVIHICCTILFAVLHLQETKSEDDLFVPDVEGRLQHLTKPSRFNTSNFEIDVSVEAFTRSNISNPCEWQECKFYDSEVKLLIPGLSVDRASQRKVVTLKDAYLVTRSQAVVIVYWTIDGELSLKSLEYSIAKISRMVEAMLRKKGIQPVNTHIVGHSLGAYVAAGIGHLSKGRLKRITALDPTAIGQWPSANLNANSADYVDVIHTSGPPIGTDKPMGKADFYPNGGIQQPPCAGDELKQTVCSHLMAWLIYIESVRRIFPRSAYQSVQCPTWGDYLSGLCDSHVKQAMGETSSPGSQGTFYLVYKCDEGLGGLGRELQADFAVRSASGVLQVYGRDARQGNERFVQIDEKINPCKLEELPESGIITAAEMILARGMFVIALTILVLLNS